MKHRRLKRGRGGAAPPPQFFLLGGIASPLLQNNKQLSFILPQSTHYDLITLLYKTLIQWVSNESVRFPAFNLAVCVTNFVVANSHLSLIFTSEASTSASISASIRNSCQVKTNTTQARIQHKCKKRTQA